MLRITPAGGAAFYLQYRRSGKSQPIPFRIGPYLAVGLANTRARVAESWADIARGRDPVQARETTKLKKVHLDNRMSFRELCELYLTERIPKQANRKNVANSFVAELYPVIGDRAAEDVTLDDAMAIWRSIRKRGAKAHAGVVFGRIKTVLNFAIKQGYLDANPLAGRSVPMDSAPRDRVLTVAELRTFWRELDGAPMQADHKTLLRLQLLLGLRIGEACTIERHEVDWERRALLVPAVKAKNRHPYTVPLPPMARAILTERLNSVKRGYLYQTAGGKPHYSTFIGQSLLRSMGHFGFKKPDGSPAPFTSHDLRRTMATHLRELKFANACAEAGIGPFFRADRTLSGGRQAGYNRVMTPLATDNTGRRMSFSRQHGQRPGLEIAPKVAPAHL